MTDWLLTLYFECEYLAFQKFPDTRPTANSDGNIKNERYTIKITRVWYRVTFKLGLTFFILGLFFTQSENLVYFLRKSFAKCLNNAFTKIKLIFLQNNFFYTQNVFWKI